MTNYVAIAKAVTKTIVGIGVGKIASTIISNNVQPDKLTDKVSVGAGSAVLGLMAADAATRYTDDAIDQIAAIVKTAKDKANPTV